MSRRPFLRAAASSFWRATAATLGLATAAFFHPQASEAAPHRSDGFRSDPALICERAVAQAARRHGAPERLLRALAKVETGRKGRPWPWTVNAGGEGRWFDSKADALAWATQKLRDGVKSIDLGCLQINRIWHGDAFRDLAHMLDPDANADYAARYLMRLERETGDWMRAAGFYHSRTKKHFDRYTALVSSAYRALEGEPSLRPGPRRAPVRPHRARRPEIRPVTREAAVKKIPDEMRVALWSGLLRRPQKALIRDLYSERAASKNDAQSRRGGVSLAFEGGGRSLLTKGSALSLEPRQSGRERRD